MRKVPRHRMRAILITAGLLTAFCLPAAAQKNEIEFRGTFSVPSGEANFSGNVSDTPVSFDRDFNFGNEPGFEIKYTRTSSTGKHKFLVEYSHTDWDRTANLSRDITILGQTYTANLDIDGDLKLQTFRALYAYRWGNEKIRFGPAVDVGVVGVSLDVTGTTNNGTRTTQAEITKF